MTFGVAFWGFSFFTVLLCSSSAFGDFSGLFFSAKYGSVFLFIASDSRSNSGLFFGAFLRRNSAGVF